MAAPDIETLLDVETETERAWGVFMRAEMQLPVVTSDSAEELQTPRFELWSVLVEEGPHQVTVSAGAYAGKRFYSLKRVRTHIDLIYSPEWGQNAGRLRGQMRAVLADYFGLKTELATNGYYRIAADSLRQVGGDRAIADNEERLSTVVEAVYFLQDAAFPA